MSDVGKEKTLFLIADSVGATSVYGVDIDDDALEVSRQKNMSVFKRDLSTDNWADGLGTFDFAYANQVIEHMYDVAGFMGNLERLVRSGGYILISTENLSSWHNCLALLLGYQPFSQVNICKDIWSIGNPLSLNKHGYTNLYMLHRAVFTHRALHEYCMFRGLKVVKVISSGYYPFHSGSVSNFLANIDRNHSVYQVLLLQKQ